MVLSFAIPGRSQDLKADEIVSKHLASVGTADLRYGDTDISLVGDVVLTVARISARDVVGKVVLASQGKKSLFAMTLPLVTYPMEKMISDGKDLSIAQPTETSRSALGEYLFTNQSLIQGGLLGGVLHKGWTLNDLAGRKARVSTNGTKKVDGREAYILSYEPNKGGGITIKLFFDKETFHHVKTEYSRMLSAQMGATPDISSRQSESYENLTEEFGDFKTEKGLTLPRAYKLTLYIQRAGSLKEYVYKFTLDDIYYNQKLDPNTFVPTSR